MKCPACPRGKLVINSNTGQLSCNKCSFVNYNKIPNLETETLETMKGGNKNEQ